jgi:ribonuclease P protein component
VLPAANRMRRSNDFASVVRGGARSRGRCLVVHHRPDLSTTAPALVGFVVGRSVGGSVVRHRVVRRLRAQMAERVDLLPPGSGTVVRALPGSGELSSGELAAGLDTALARLVSRR